MRRVPCTMQVRSDHRSRSLSSPPKSAGRCSYTRQGLPSIVAAMTSRPQAFRVGGRSPDLGIAFMGVGSLVGSGTGCSALELDTGNHLSDAGRLGDVLNLDSDLRLDLDPVPVDVVGCEYRARGPEPGADRDRGREADPVEAVVHRQPGVLDPPQLAQE